MSQPAQRASEGALTPLAEHPCAAGIPQVSPRLQELSVAKDRGRSCDRPHCSGSRRHREAKRRAIPTDVLLSSWKDGPPALRHTQPAEFDATLGLCSTPSTAGIEPDSRASGSRPVTAPEPFRDSHRGAEVSGPAAPRRPFTALQTQVRIDRRVRRAKDVQRKAEGVAVVEHFSAFSTSAGISDTPAQRSYSRSVMRVKQLATRATRINLAALKTLRMANKPTGPKQGADHFTALPLHCLDVTTGSFDVTASRDAVLPICDSDSTVAEQLRPDHERVVLPDGWDKGRIAVLLQALCEHPTATHVHLGANRVTHTIAALVERLAEVNECIVCVEGGLCRKGGTYAHSEALQRLLQRNAVLSQSREQKGLHLLHLKEEAERRARLHNGCMLLLEEEWVHRNIVMRQQTAQRAALRAQKHEEHDDINTQIAQERARRNLMIRLDRMETYESHERPRIEDLAQYSVLSIVCLQEDHWRLQVASEEHAARHVVRKKGYASWELQYKSEKRRHECEKLARKEFEGVEAASRVSLKEHEYTGYLEVVRLAEESWEVVDRIMQARAAREEEERRRVALKLAEEERENLWRREKQQKEEERLITERHVKREQLAKEEKKARAVVRKAEEVCRTLFREMFDVDLKLAVLASQVRAAIDHRSDLLDTHPTCELVFAPDYIVPFFEGVSDVVNVSPRDVQLRVSLPDDWVVRMQKTEALIFKHARAEAVARYESSSSSRKLQEAYLQQLAAVGVPPLSLSRPNEGRSPEYISSLVDFPALDSVMEQKTRIWGGNMRCAVEAEAGDDAPSLAEDVLFVDDTNHSCTDGQHACESHAINVRLVDSGCVTPHEVCRLLEDVLYACPAEAQPFVRHVKYAVSIEVADILSTEGWALAPPCSPPEAPVDVLPPSPPPQQQQQPEAEAEAASNSSSDDYDEDYEDVDEAGLGVESAVEEEAVSPAAAPSEGVPQEEQEEEGAERVQPAVAQPAAAGQQQQHQGGKAKSTLERIKDMFAYPRETRMVPPEAKPFSRQRLTLTSTACTFVGFQKPYLRFFLESTQPQVSVVDRGLMRGVPSPLLSQLKSLDLVGKNEGLQMVLPTILQYDYFDTDHVPVPLTPFAVDVEMPASYAFDQSASSPGNRKAKLQTEGRPRTFEDGMMTITFKSGYTQKDAVLVSTGAHLTVNTDTHKIYLDDAELGVALTPLKQWCANSNLLYFKPQVSPETRFDVEVLKIHFTRSVSKFKLKNLLQQLYFCNNSKDPLVGTRIIEIHVSDASNLTCSVKFHVNVKWLDVPTRLVIEDTKLNFKTPCRSDISEHHLPFIEKNIMPVLLNAKLVDPDTDRFCGGFLVITLSGTDTGTDGVYIQTSPNPQVGITVTLPPGSPWDANRQKSFDILFNDTLFATASYKAGEASEEPCEISVNFTTDGAASIVAAECLLRAICYYTTELLNIPPGVRSVDISMLVGPTMMKYDVNGDPVQTGGEGAVRNMPLAASVSIRVCAPAVKVAQKHVNMKYLEGSGLRRLGPFELCSDEENGTKDWSGFLKAEVAEGCEDGDVVCLKEDYGLRLHLVSEANEPIEVATDFRRRRSSTDFASLLEGSTTAVQPSAASGGVSGDAESGATSANEASASFEAENGNLSAEAAPAEQKQQRGSPCLRMKLAAQGIAADIKKNAPPALPQGMLLDFMDKLKDKRKGIDSRFRKGRASKYDVSVDDLGGHRNVIGSLFISPTGALLLQFVKKIKRSQVLTAIKCLSYSHESTDPRELEKKIRVTVASVNTTASHCIIDMTIQPVDDVTEILLKNDRVLYRQGTSGDPAVHAFRICPLGAARLEDPDTTCFDGGELGCVITAGGTKGDGFALMTVEQQQAQYDLFDATDAACDPVTEAIIEHRPLIVAEDVTPAEAGAPPPDRRLLVNGVQVATMIHGRSKSYSAIGIYDIKILFAKQPSSPTAGGDQVPVEAPDSASPSVAAPPPLVPLWLASYMLNILAFSNLDNEKSRDGVRSVRLSVCDPENPVPGKASLQIQVLGPTISLPSAHETGVAIGVESAVAPKILVLVSDKGFLMRGFFEAVLVAQEPDDVLSLSASKSGLALKDGILNDGPKFIGKADVTPTSVRVDFSVQSKATRDSLQRLARGVCITLGESVSAVRMVRFTLCDKQAEPNVLTIAVRKKQDDVVPVLKAAGKLKLKR